MRNKTTDFNLSSEEKDKVETEVRAGIRAVLRTDPFKDKDRVNKAKIFADALQRAFSQDSPRCNRLRKAGRQWLEQPASVGFLGVNPSKFNGWWDDEAQKFSEKVFDTRCVENAMSVAA